MTQGIAVVSALALVGAVIALLVAALRGLGIRKKVGSLGGAGRGRR